MRAWRWRWRARRRLGAWWSITARPNRLVHEGKGRGFVCEDAESGQQFTVRARSVVNATGCGWTPCARWTAKPSAAVKPMVAPSQGVHIVVDRSSCRPTTP